MNSWRLPTSLMIVALLTWPNGGSTGPLEGYWSGDKIKIDAGNPGRWEEKFAFAGGERACIIVKGDHDPVVDIGIVVKDANGKVVAKDHGRGDFAAVVWYPPEDGVYTVVVTNPNDQYNNCHVAIR
jgi:hypothetical protein